MHVVQVEVPTRCIGRKKVLRYLDTLYTEPPIP